MLDRDAMQLHRLMSIAAAFADAAAFKASRITGVAQYVPSGAAMGRLHVKQTRPPALISRPVSHTASASLCAWA